LAESLGEIAKISAALLILFLGISYSYALNVSDKVEITSLINSGQGKRPKAATGLTFFWLIKI